MEKKKKNGAKIKTIVRYGEGLIKSQEYCLNNGFICD